ncbi:MAG: hydantoinase/oxoprolinase family protein [Planctomycetota bacterium]
MSSWTGLDIGGANIKYAVVAPSTGLESETKIHALQQSGSVNFELWKRKSELADALALMADDLPSDNCVAVTMTGELADCFENKREGVRFIVDKVEQVFGSERSVFYQVGGVLVDADEARNSYKLTAAANWHALATYCTRFLKSESGLLIDIGSTTTDIIPISNGQVAAKGSTDTQRICNNELVYTGVTRSPICSLISFGYVDGRKVPLAQEVFATALDAHVILGNIPPDENNLATSDGRPATVSCCKQRIARMFCADREELADDTIYRLADQAAYWQQRLLRSAVGRVIKTHRLPKNFTVVVSGIGSWLARRILIDLVDSPDVVSLEELLGPRASASAPAFSLAMLAARFGIGV